jgi:hypothetical protein
MAGDSEREIGRKDRMSPSSRNDQKCRQLHKPFILHFNQAVREKLFI